MHYGSALSARSSMSLVGSARCKVQLPGGGCDKDEALAFAMPFCTLCGSLPRIHFQLLKHIVVKYCCRKFRLPPQILVENCILSIAVLNLRNLLDLFIEERQ